jgi:orotidine-5'-phosphate decarboxylase
MVTALKDDVRLFKVGLELFSSCGPGIVGAIKEKGCGIFLDLKFHDIPHTVSKSAAAVTRLGAFMFNVHALGGYEMMKNAASAVKEESSRLKIPKPKILAVTILTSMDLKALKDIGIETDTGKEALALAKLAKRAGLDGVVASAHEVKTIKEELGKDFLVVTPGIRPKGGEAHDQKRVTTPKDAIKAGADYIVVGRPITEARDPAEAARMILKEMEG